MSGEATAGEATAGALVAVHRVRSPSGGAWLATAFGLISSGEIFSEWRKEGPGILFGYPLHHDELTWALVAASVVALVALAQLIAVYARPGVLRLDGAAGIIERQEGKGLLRRRWQAALGDWQVRILFFSDKEKARGEFKRLELVGAGHREILLTGDVPSPSRLVGDLTALGSRLGALRLDVERKTVTEADPAPARQSGSPSDNGPTSGPVVG